MANYPFPNQKLELGSTGRFVTDLQRELGIAVTGVFDFLTMCKVAVHKFESGLNHNDPTVGAETWNTIFNRGDNAQGGGGDNAGANDRRDNNPANPAPAAAADREGVATRGEVQRNRDTDEPTTNGNPRATTNGNTVATDENTPAAAVETDRPREDQPTVTASEQQAAGGPAGGYAAAPTEQTPNAPTPTAQAAGAESAEGDQVTP
jgi:hypothetical protein